MRNPKLLAYAQLLRLPNVFTALADIGMAGAAAGVVTSLPAVFVLLLLASGGLYLAGMVWNDWFDRHEDAAARPFRPLPSGRVTPRRALTLGVVLLAAGVGFAFLADAFVPNPSAVGPTALAGLALAAAILLYDGWLKRTPLGPVGMGLCRSLNVWLGLSVTPDLSDELRLHLAGTVGLYIVGVTWFARTEEGSSDRWQLTYAAGVMLLSLGLGLAVPAHLPAGSSPWFFPYLVVAFGFLIGVPIHNALRRPEPKRVQAAVKRCILGLVVLDAVLATAFVGPWGLLILLLLPPALWLGKWVYST